MADWKDFVEDNKERAGQFLDSLEARSASRRLPSPSPPPARECPICLDAFYSNDSLEDHIRQVHGRQHVYLRVNGSIVRDIGWAQNGIQSLEVVLLGYLTANIKINAGGVHESLTAQARTSLLGHFRKDFEGELHIRIEPPNGRERAFCIYCHSLPEFNQKSLDQEIWDRQHSFGLRGLPPNLREWRESCGVEGNSSTLEDRYVNGFFEFTMGFALEKTGNVVSAKDHFEDALGYLLPFRTLLAEQAQCVLGLKMNCFAVLVRCSDGSIFSPARAFFLRYPEPWKVPKKWPPKNSLAVYADEFIQRLLRVIELFYGNDRSEFWQGTAALKFHPAAADRNNADKLSILQARAFARYGNSDGAREAYKLLRYNPYFGSEAEEFLKNAK